MPWLGIDPRMIHLSLCLVAAAIAALALFVWRARPDSKVNRWFAAFTFSTAGWVLGVAGFFGGTHVDAWGRFTFASASLIPAAFFLFAHSYSTAAQWPSSVWTRVVLFFGLTFAFLSFMTPLIAHDTSITAAGLTRKSGPLYPLFALYFIATWSCGLGICVYKWRRARG